VLVYHGRVQFPTRYKYINKLPHLIADKVANNNISLAMGKKENRVIEKLLWGNGRWSYAERQKRLLGALTISFACLFSPLKIQPCKLVRNEREVRKYDGRNADVLKVKASPP